MSAHDADDARRDTAISEARRAIVQKANNLRGLMYGTVDSAAAGQALDAAIDALVLAAMAASPLPETPRGVVFYGHKRRTSDRLPRTACECGAAFEEHDGRPFTCGNFHAAAVAPPPSPSETKP